jgi:hypothetical protein
MSSDISDGFSLSSCSVQGPFRALVNETSVLLQSPQLDILRSNQHVNNLSVELAILRAYTAWESAVISARQFADQIGLESTFN